MAICVRNEAELLPANLLYHRALGVDRAYVFLDRCTDGSEQVAAALPWVRGIRLDPADSERFEYVPDLHRVCFDRAMELACEEGYRWLLVLDADEFAFGDNPTRQFTKKASVLLRGNLPAMLSRAGRQTEQIRLCPKEVVPAALDEDTPFWRQRFFQDDYDFQRRILDPISGKLHQWSGVLGHPWGKSIVRTSADVQSIGSHRWVPNQGRKLPARPMSAPLNQEELGFHYHFIFTTRRHWQDKYRKLAHEPNHWHMGIPVEFTKQCWKRAVTTLKEEELAEYFSRWVALPESQLEELAAHGLLRKESFVEQVLSAAGNLVDGKIRMPFAGDCRAELWRMPSFELELPPEAWRRVCEATGAVTFIPADMPRDTTRGFALPEFREGKVFRWAEPKSQLLIDPPAADYRMTVDMGPMQSLWSGQMQVIFDRKPIPACQTELDTGQASVVLHRSDFADSSPHVLELSFQPIDTSTWPAPDPRALGAPVFAVQFLPLAASAASAA